MASLRPPSPTHLRCPPSSKSRSRSASPCRLRSFQSRSSDPAVHLSWAPKILGEAQHVSPLDTAFEFEDEQQKQFLDIVSVAAHEEGGAFSSSGTLTTGGEQIPSGRPVMVELAGPRKNIFFDPKTTTVGIVTCGGLSPGLNNVVRGLVLCMWHRYGVRNFVGFRYGYEGLNPEKSEIMDLTPEKVRNIHKNGGTILGTSRGPQDEKKMAEYLIEKKVNILFSLGGDGTLRGALKISQVLEEMKQKISVVGIPKTIDNDISFTDRTFGFETAVDIAARTISSIHNEAISHKGGVGIIKLMGRHSGFISLHASIASGDANLVLLPEVKFTWEGLGKYLTHRFIDLKKSDTVIVVAEGAGQDLLEDTNQTDASGNKKLVDIGLAVKDFVGKHMKSLELDHTVKYVDPAYIIRSSEASTSDALYCIHLAQMAAHAAMAGRTEIVISRMHGSFVHIPIQKAVESRKTIDPNGWLYETLLDATGQPKELV